MKTNPSMLPPLFFAVTTLGFCCAYGQGTPPPAPAVGGENILKEPKEEAVSAATGTVFSLEADALSLTTEKSAIPLAFMTTSATSFVDEEEKEVARDLVRKGTAATVHYTTLGEKLLATKVTFTREDLTGGEPADPVKAERKRAILTETKEIKKEEAARAKAVAAEGNGTLMGFEQILTVRAPGDTTVTQYTINNSTLSVDSAGNPVPPHAVRTGAGLHVQFVEDAGRKIATRVIIQTMPAWAREGLIAAESGTSVTPGTNHQTTTRTRTTTSGTTGNDLADAFIYPPISSLAGDPASGPPRINTPRLPYDSANPTANNQVDPNQPNTITPGNNNNNQPGTTAPNNNRSNPGTTQPGNTQPGNTQPGTKQPGTKPSGPSQPGNKSAPSAPSSPSSPSAGSATR